MTTGDVNKKLGLAIDSLSFIRKSTDRDYRLVAIAGIAGMLDKLAKDIKETR